MSNVILAAYNRWEQHYTAFIKNIPEDFRRHEERKRRQQIRSQFKQQAGVKRYRIYPLEVAWAKEVQNDLIQYMSEPLSDHSQQVQWQQELQQTEQHLQHYRAHYRRLSTQLPEKYDYLQKQDLQSLREGIRHLKHQLSAQYDQLIASYPPGHIHRFRLKRQRKIVLTPQKTNQKLSSFKEAKQHSTKSPPTQPQNKLAVYRQQYKFFLSWNKHYPPLGLFDSRELKEWLAIRQQQQAAALVASHLAAQCQAVPNFPNTHEVAKRAQVLWQPLVSLSDALLKACQNFHKQQGSPTTPLYQQLKAYYRVLLQQSRQLISRTQNLELLLRFNEQMQKWSIELFNLMGENFCKAKEINSEIRLPWNKSYRCFQQSESDTNYLTHQFECGLFNIDVQENKPQAVRQQLAQGFQELMIALNHPTEEKKLATHPQWKLYRQQCLENISRYASHCHQRSAISLPQPPVQLTEETLWQQACTYMFKKGQALRQRYLQLKTYWLQRFMPQQTCLSSPPSLPKKDSKSEEKAAINANPSPPEMPQEVKISPQSQSPPEILLFTTIPSTHSAAFEPSVPTHPTSPPLIVREEPRMNPSSSPELSMSITEPREQLTTSMLTTTALLPSSAVPDCKQINLPHPCIKIQPLQISSIPQEITLTSLTKQVYPQLLQDLAEFKQGDLMSNEIEADKREALITRFKDFCQHCYQLVKNAEPLQRPTAVANLVMLQINLLERGNDLWLDTFLSLPIIFKYGLNDLSSADYSFFNPQQRQVLEDVTIASIFDINLEIIIRDAIVQKHNTSDYLKRQVEKAKKRLLLHAHPDKYQRVLDVVKFSTWKEHLPHPPSDNDLRKDSRTLTLHEKWKQLFNQQFQNVEDKVQKIVSFKYSNFPLCNVYSAHLPRWQQAYTSAYARGQHLKNQIQFFQYSILLHFFQAQWQKQHGPLSNSLPKNPGMQTLDSYKEESARGFAAWEAELDAKIAEIRKEAAERAVRLDAEMVAKMEKQIAEEDARHAAFFDELDQEITAQMATLKAEQQDIKKQTIEIFDRLQAEQQDIKKQTTEIFDQVTSQVSRYKKSIYRNICQFTSGATRCREEIHRKGRQFTSGATRYREEIHRKGRQFTSRASRYRNEI